MNINIRSTMKSFIVAGTVSTAVLLGGCQTSEMNAFISGFTQTLSAIDTGSSGSASSAYNVQMQYLTNALYGSGISKSRSYDSGANRAGNTRHSSSSRATSSGSYTNVASTDGSCQNMERALTAKVQRLERQSSGVGMCQLHKINHSLMSGAVEFYKRCPSYDPTGDMLRQSKNSVRQSEQGIRAACS